MTLFFLVSLEIKRELLQGELNSWDKALLPVLAAIGGMQFGTRIFLLANQSCRHSAYIAGWAIPMATDIAFSLAVLSLLNKKNSSCFKKFF